MSDGEMVPTDHLDDGEHPLPKTGGIVVTKNHLFAELWAPKQATSEGDRQKQEDVEEEAGDLVLCAITTGMWGPKQEHSTRSGKWSYTTAIEEKNMEPTTAADGERGKIGGS